MDPDTTDQPTGAPGRARTHFRCKRLATSPAQRLANRVTQPRMRETPHISAKLFKPLNRESQTTRHN